LLFSLSSSSLADRFSFFARLLLRLHQAINPPTSGSASATAALLASIPSAAAALLGVETESADASSTDSDQEPSAIPPSTTFGSVLPAFRVTIETKLSLDQFSAANQVLSASASSFLLRCSVVCCHSCACLLIALSLFFLSLLFLFPEHSCRQSFFHRHFLLVVFL
jgi:hypothetical protein